MKSSTLASSCWLMLSSAFAASSVNGHANMRHAAEGPTTNLQDCIPEGELDPHVDYFPEKFVHHDTVDLLTIEYFKTYKIVTNKYNDKTYLLYQCGTKPPSNELNNDRHHLVLPIPHKAGVAITETPQIPPLELLGLREEITTYIGDPQYVSSTCLRHRMDVIQDVEIVHNEADPYNSTWKANATANWINENPDSIIFGGPIGNDSGDRVMTVAASQERTNVAMFDWIGLYAALYNMEGMANKIVKDTEERYDCSASNAQVVSADIPDNEKPTLLWANYISGYGWSVAECPTSDSTYYCEYANHCGVNILSRPPGAGTFETFGGTTKYWYLTDDEMLELGKDAKYWIYSGKTWDTIYAEKKELLDQFKAVQTKQVFDTQGQGPNAWYEQRLAEYDVVALDFCHIAGMTPPTQFEKNRWFRNLFSQPIGSLTECKVPEELTEPYVPAEAQCTLMEIPPQTGGGGASAGWTTRSSLWLTLVAMASGAIAAVVAGW